MALSLRLTDSSAIELENRKLYFNGGQHTAAEARKKHRAQLPHNSSMIQLIYEINVLVSTVSDLKICSILSVLICMN